MQPLQIVDRAHAADATEFTLANRGDEWLVSAGGRILMSSRMHFSEEEFARKAIGRVKDPAHVLIGGLGMGYTVATALTCLTESGRVTVAELLPELVEWNRTHLSHLAGHPLRDPRCVAAAEDIYDVLVRSPATFDVIVLDVDNGPIALSSAGNQRLYSARGVRLCLAALRPGGVLGVWSAAPSAAFENRLRGIGVQTEVVTVPAHPTSKAKHTLFFTHAPSGRAAQHIAGDDANPPPATPAKPTAAKHVAPKHAVPKHAVPARGAAARGPVKRRGEVPYKHSNQKAAAAAKTQPRAKAKKGPR